MTKDNSQEVTVISPPRLLYHPALKDMGVDQNLWRLLCESIFPSAKTVEGIALAVRYCKLRKLDIMKRPVHVVPVYNAKLRKTVELVWPGISEYRTTAARTGNYGGCDPIEEGELVEKKFIGSKDIWENDRKTGTESIEATIKHREWMRLTVYRIVGGMRCAFPGPKVYFEEIYSRINNKCDFPNERWQKSPMGMLEKCAEAAALRKAFPEEFGNEPTAEEMEGKIVDGDAPMVLPTVNDADLKADTDQHMKDIGGETKDPHSKDIGQENAMRDWDAILDELSPGLNGCATENEIHAFLEDHEPWLKNISANAPKEIQIKWATLVSKKREDTGKEAKKS